MRFHEVGLERTSIGYFTGPPGLVDNTAKSITCEDKKTVKQPTTLVCSKAYWWRLSHTVRQAGSKKSVYLRLTTTTVRLEWKFQKHGYPTTRDHCRGKQLTATARIKRAHVQQLKTSHSLRSIVLRITCNQVKHDNIEWEEGYYFLIINSLVLCVISGGLAILRHGSNNL